MVATVASGLSDTAFQTKPITRDNSLLQGCHRAGRPCSRSMQDKSPIRWRISQCIRRPFSSTPEINALGHQAGGLTSRASRGLSFELPAGKNIKR
jgi:hypothetical protein